MAQSNPLKSIKKNNKRPKSSHSGGKIKPKTMAISLLVVFALLLVVIFTMQDTTTLAQDHAAGQNDMIAESQSESGINIFAVFDAIQRKKPKQKGKADI